MILSEFVPDVIEQAIAVSVTICAVGAVNGIRIALAQGMELSSADDWNHPKPVFFFH